MSQPIIAVSGRSITISGITAYSMQQTYIDGITQAGGLPLMVVPNPQQDYSAIVNICDGLLITGGRDVATQLYGQSPHTTVECELLSVDEMDIALIKAFHQQNKPILGICRGQQVINVAFGGTLIQDIPTTHPSQINHVQTTTRFFTSHEVRVIPGTKLSELLPASTAVNSLHHQAIDQLAHGFTVSAYADDDIIEAIEYNNILAVQWHPEGLLADENHLKIFQSLIEQCKKGTT
jgi:putative glutamine amidotransferase